jgi:hypothetical protein
MENIFFRRYKKMCLNTFLQDQDQSLKSSTDIEDVIGQSRCFGFSIGSLDPDPDSEERQKRPKKRQKREEIS